MTDELKVVYVTYIQATPDEVWVALTHPAFSAAFWAHSNASDWLPGSPWRHLRIDGSGIADGGGTVLESTSPERLVLTWDDIESGEAAAGAAPTRVAFDIEAGEGIVRFTVTHDQLATEAQRKELAAGWAAVVSNLKTYLESGHPLPQAPWEMPQRRVS